MSIFHDHKLKEISRVMSATRGIEKTPQEWEDTFYQWIADARAEYPEQTESWTDDDVWEEILRQVKKFTGWKPKRS
jgi:hypothetical protein